MLFDKRIIGLDGCELLSTTERTAALFDGRQRSSTSKTDRYSMLLKGVLTSHWGVISQDLKVEKM
jgi:hypothetical protein